MNKAVEQMNKVIKMATQTNTNTNKQKNSNRNEKTIGMKKLVQIGMIKLQIGMKKPIGMKNGYK